MSSLASHSEKIPYLRNKISSLSRSTFMRFSKPLVSQLGGRKRRFHPCAHSDA